ncbi:MAG: hypothetical protein HOQ09_05875, partial [Gemmatimonadaceae bacterium]|nr:hypothetical protein [Gemmatimonadaceae bacterium]
MGEARTLTLTAPFTATADSSAVDRAVRGCVDALDVDARLVLAVSGGRDSMVLLAAFARLAPERVAAVATFDHGTGVTAAEAVDRVVEECARLDLAVVAGRDAL